MPNRSRKDDDVNVTAFEILNATTQEKPVPPSKEKPIKEKNPAAIALGRLGGKKGGPARAAKLSAKKRKEIARKAAFGTLKRLAQIGKITHVNGKGFKKVETIITET